MKRLNVFISVVLSIIVAISCSNEDENVSINANTSRPIIINFRKMRLLFVLVLLGSLFLNSCNKEEENNVENIEISDVFYEDFFDVDNIGLVRDSLYFINSEEKLKQITNDFPSVYAKISKTDFDKNTVVITASRQDYNLFKYEVKLFLDKMTATCKLVFSYVLDEPPYLEKTYFRVWVCVVPKMTSPRKSYVYEGIY